jgi:hypothetical protein
MRPRIQTLKRAKLKVFEAELIDEEWWGGPGQVVAEQSICHGRKVVTVFLRIDQLEHPLATMGHCHETTVAADDAFGQQSSVRDRFGVI